MHDDALAQLQHRVVHLERRQRFIARGGLLVVVFAAGIALLGQAAPQPGAPATPPRTVEAETFIVRDRGGRARAAMSLGIDDRRGVALADARGKIRAWAHDRHRRLARAPVLRRRRSAARRADGRRRAGQPGLVLSDARGKARARLDLGSEGAPRLALFDRAEKLRGSLGIDAAELAAIGVTDADGRACATMSVRAFGLPAFALTGRDGKGVWKAP